MFFLKFLPTFNDAPYSYVLVPIIVASSIAGFIYKPYFHALILHPYEVYRKKRRHTLITSAFVHRNWVHLIFNSIVIYALTYDMFGCIKQEYGLVYALSITPALITLLIAVPNMIQVGLQKNKFEFTSIGASGASFGLYGFSGLFYPFQKIDHLFIPWIKNAAQYWFYILLIITVLSFIKGTKVNRTLHLLAYLFGSLLALTIQREALSELFKAFLAY
jgi:membrane associated rhomboid family serine protease